MQGLVCDQGNLLEFTWALINVKYMQEEQIAGLICIVPLVGMV